MRPDLTRESQETVERHGEDVTLHNYSQTGTDEYGDPTFSETTSSASALLDFPGGGNSPNDAAGIHETQSMVMWIPTTYDVQPATDSNPKPTVVERKRTGNFFKVLTRVDDGSGLYQCECERREQ